MFFQTHKERLQNRILGVAFVDWHPSRVFKFMEQKRHVGMVFKDFFAVQRLCRSESAIVASQLHVGSHKFGENSCKVAS